MLGSGNQEEEISVLALKELTILGRDRCTPNSSNRGISGVTEGHTRCYWVNQKPPWLIVNETHTPIRAPKYPHLLESLHHLGGLF